MAQLAKILGKLLGRSTEEAAAPELKTVFKEGIGNLSNEQLAELFAKNRTQRVVRFDRHAEDLMERGWDPELAKNGPLASDWSERAILNKGYSEEELSNMVRTGNYPEDVQRDVLSLTREPFDQPGIYWHNREHKFDTGILPPYQEAKPTNKIEGLLNPEGSYNEGLVPGEIVQSGPNTVLAKMGDKYRIIGLAAGLGMGGAAAMADTDEAQAGVFDIGKLVKQSAKTRPDSSAKELIGETFMGRTVKAVKKGLQDWRYIQFEDGTEVPVKKGVVWQLCREVGTKAKMGELETKDTESQLLQAIKSLDFHAKRQKAFSTKNMQDDYRKQYTSVVKEMGMEPEEMVYITQPIQGYIPQKYAEILEAAGLVQVKKKKK